jgi:hypothetical protein
MKLKCVCGVAVGLFGLLCSAHAVLAQSTEAIQEKHESPVAINQTEGFADGQVLVFTYLQNFSCIHEPFDDLDHNGKVAAVDPHEFQRPICAVGKQPTIDPTGAPISQVENLWVLVPFFDSHRGDDEAFNPPLTEFVKDDRKH